MTCTRILFQSFTVRTTTIDISRQISSTAATQAIKYQISPITIGGTKLIDESGLQESNPKPYKPSTRSTK
jgi:hypothetical protein